MQHLLCVFTPWMYRNLSCEAVKLARKKQRLGETWSPYSTLKSRKHFFPPKRHVPVSLHGATTYNPEEYGP